MSHQTLIWSTIISNVTLTCPGSWDLETVPHALFLKCAGGLGWGRSYPLPSLLPVFPFPQTTWHCLLNSLLLLEIFWTRHFCSQWQYSKIWNGNFVDSETGLTTFVRALLESWNWQFHKVKSKLVPHFLSQKGVFWLAGWAKYLSLGVGWVLLLVGPGILSTFRHPKGVNLLGGGALHAVGPCWVGGR